MPLNKGRERRRVIDMRRLKLAVATFLLVVSVVAPLFAGYCMNCYSGQCEPGCSPVRTNKIVSACSACRLQNGTYACTACDFIVHQCVKNGYTCSRPPYIYGLDYEEDKWRTYPPFSCVWIEGVGYRCL